MSFTNLIRQRQNGQKNRTRNVLRQDAIEREFDAYKAYHDDCVKIDVEALPAAVEFNPKSASDLLVADDRGSVAIIDPYQETAEKRIKRRWRAHRNAILAATWTSDGSTILCSSADRSISSWKEGKLAHSFQPDGTVRCLATSPVNNFVFAAGGRDCDISLFDSRELRRNGMVGGIKPTRRVEACHYPGQVTQQARRRSTLPNHRNPHLTMQDKTVSSLHFLNEFEFISCGVSDQTIKLWDSRKLRDHRDAKLVLRSPTQRGFTSLAALNNSVYVSCLDGAIYEFGLNTSNTKPRRSFHGHSCEGSGCVYLKLDISPTLRKLLIGSTDGYARVYSIDSSTRRYQAEETPLESVIKVGGGGGNPTLYCSWSTRNAIGLASDDAVVSVYKSDFDKYERLNLPAERLYGRGEQCHGEHRVSFKHAAPVEPSFGLGETLSELNFKYTSIKAVSDPGRLWYLRPPKNAIRPSTKRRFEADDQTIKGRAPKRIVLQTRVSNLRIGSPRRPNRPTTTTAATGSAASTAQQSSITRFFSPKPK